MKFIYFCIPYSVVTFQESVTVFYLVSWIGDLCFVVRKAASLPRLAFIFFEHLETWVPFISTVFFKMTQKLGVISFFFQKTETES